MAEDQPAPTPKTFARGILLVEPYDALCIAISSALRRFAPHHALRVTQTLADAETATEMIRPELFVLDLDPPPTNEVEFFTRLRRRHPETRVLVIATNTSRDLSAVRGLGGAFQFIKKPFELGDFGATVQALLGRWDVPAGKKTRGTLRDLCALDFVELKCLGLATSVLRVESSDGETGEIHFRHGEIFHAFTDEEEGVAALREILSWRGGKFREGTIPPKPRQTIDRPWQHLLLEVLPAPDENESLGEELPPEEAPHSLGKTILVIDDTEMLRIFAADVLHLANPRFRILTAASGAEGLRLATTNSVDLVLLDYCLTDTTGAEVCRALLAQEATARVPVLLMSGHLPELENTARNFSNVVTTLAKPFLSGALINEVEKILAAGPVPVPVPQAPKAEPAVPKTEAVPTELPPLPNEHKTGGNGHIFATAPTTPAMLVQTPAAVATPVVSRPSPNEMPATLADDHGDVVATLSCEVISVQLAPDFRMGALRLKPESSAVVRLNSANGRATSPLEKDFRLGPTSLTADGRIETMRLVPIPPFFRPAFGGGNFDVDWVSAEPAAGGALMQLTGAQHATMHVKLIAEFEVVRVELSDDFAVAAVVLRPRSDEVRVQTGESSAVAMHFFLQAVELDEEGLLAGLTVGSRR